MVMPRSKWTTGFLGDIAEEIRVLYGPISSEDLPYIGLGHIDQQTMRILEIGHSSSTDSTKKVFQAGEILFGSLRPYFRKVVRPKFGGVCSTDITVLRARPGVDPRFLLYLVGSPQFISYATSVSSGTRMPRTNWNVAAEFECAIPDLDTQRKIGSILSAYDDLIENNLRRIAILEEMAQAIYREWFVEFRYPGHEDVSMVDSELGPIPDGWNVTSFSDVADVLSGGTPRTSVPEYWGGDIPFFTPKDSGGSFWAIATERTITRLGLDNCNSQLYPKETIFITARGTVGKVALSSADMAVNQSCYALRSKDGVSQYFVFLALRAEAATLRKQAHGAVFDTITMDTFDRLRLAVPPEHLLDSWDRTVGDMMQLSLNLSLTNLRLGEIRDLLLPRLISGELDVSDIAMSTEVDNL